MAMASSELPSGTESTDEPSLLSIFVNEALLPKAPSHSLNFPHDGFQQFERTFMVDGIGVQESEGVERLRKFEVYSVGDMEQYSDDIDMSGSEDRHLELYIENVPNGVVINSNVFLNYHQWNTLVFVSETTFTCAVCGVYCDEEHDEEHIKLDTHIINLSKHKPLYQYDLSIVRKINDYYHCGVCNLLFRVAQDEHFTSETHGEKMLSALNKVSDIMYDYNTHNVKTDTYHYSAKAINNNNLDLTSSEDEENDSEYNDDGNSYGDLKYVENDDDEDDDDFYDNVEPPLSLEHSYASMARKPKTDDLPKVLEIDLGNKKVTVNYNSWNMVINPKLNRFYCMVCTTFGHVRVQAEHCRSLDHVERLARCRVVDMYEMYLVRQVDDKLYHCGHCNNLQLIHEMEDHIESQHPANRQTHVDSPIRTPSTPLKNYPKTKPNITNNDKENSKNGVNNSTIKTGTHSQPIKNNTNINIPKNQTGDGNLNMYHDLRLANSNINENLVICAYGRTVKISKMAYNIVCTRANDFYCGLCEVSVGRESIKLHVNDLQHLILLQRTPFIEAFNIHLFRQIRDALHCALCNELIQLIPAIIISHKFEPKHVKCLQESSGQIANEKVPTAVKSAEKPASFNTGNNIVKEATFLSNIKTAAATSSSEKVNNAAKNMTNNKATQNNVKTSVKFKKLHNNAVTLSQEEMEIKNAANGKTEPDLEVSTEFIEVKNGVKDDLDDDSDNLDDSLTEEFDFEEYVYVKLGNVFIKITNTAYNTLVEVGDGTKYCFVCAFVVDRELKKHIESRGHMENMEKCKFVDKYKEDLLRQIYLMYHCSICNVLVTRKQLNQHLSWPTHVLQTENTKISGKQRKTDIKSGMKQYVISTINENIYLNETETKVKVYLNVLMQKENVVNVVRKNKIIIFNDNVLKISFDAWHSLSEVPNGWKCKVCQCEFDAKEIATHVASDWHIGNLEKFEKKYSPALVRKINDATLNCVMCNTEVSNKKQIALEHIQGKKHKKSFDAILEESSVANSYADCDEDVLTL